MIKLPGFLIVNAGLMLVSTASCGQFEQATPEKYKYSVEIPRKKYIDDSIYLYYVLESMLIKNIEPFTPANYYTDKSTIYLDSVLYSPDKSRLVAFVITKVVTKRDSNNKTEYGYNGNYLFCEKNQTGNSIKVFNYGPFTLSNYSNSNDLRLALRDLVFRRRSGQRWSDSQPKYNMDDKRFWTSDEFNSITSSTVYTQLE